jgi:hypothetical protein
MHAIQHFHVGNASALRCELNLAGHAGNQRGVELMDFGHCKCWNVLFHNSAHHIRGVGQNLSNPSKFLFTWQWRKYRTSGVRTIGKILEAVELNTDVR